jgi:C-3',4' desaturase CrtD
MKKENNKFDIIVIGAGMGGLTAASLLSAEGYRVLVLEASHVAGGCSSSYYRKGYIFESGATTLIGFDEYQPLKKLEEKLGITIPKVPLSPSMRVHLNGLQITRRQDREEWIEEVSSHFGEHAAQRAFWELAYKVSDVVWRVSGRNHFFPPVKLAEWPHLLKNDLRDVWVLPYAFTSVKETALKVGISNPYFYRFLDEQLIISSQADSRDTPFLFGAPAVTYTNYTNYYVPGGLIKMVDILTGFIKERGGSIQVKESVISVEKNSNGYEILTSKKRSYTSETVISNLPVWNMPGITHGDMKSYFEKESSKYDIAWGAFTMGVVTDDVYPEDFPLHHQVHLDEDEKTAGLDSKSVFVSFSERGDNLRAPEGERVLNISTHAETDFWFELNGDYESRKETVQEAVIQVLRKKLPGFDRAIIKLQFSATPVSWNNWVYRRKGRVGGIPQSMSRSLLDWTPNKTPFKGFYLCGDTVFPGQGIPGVTLSGFNVYHRITGR